MSHPNERGFSLIEVLIVAGVMGIVLLAMMTMQSNQLKATNFLEFRLKKTELKTVLLGQFLTNPDHCACLFAGAADFPATPTAPGVTLTGVNPTAIGLYHFTTPGDCTTATMPQKLVDNVGVDGMKATSIQLTDIMNNSGVYSGTLTIALESTKDVLGPKALQPLKIPVTVATAPSGSNVSFKGCSMGGGGSSDGVVDPTPLLSASLPTQNYGMSSGSARSFSMPGACTFHCGSKVVMTVPGSSADDVGAFISFAHSGPKDTIFYTYDMSDNVTGAYGAYQDGDGQDRDYGYDMLVKTTGGKFKAEQCSCNTESTSVTIRAKYYLKSP